MGAYLECLALCWKLEQRPHLTSLDRELQTRAQLAVALGDAALDGTPRDARALLARGGAWGVLSRYHLFRLHRRDAARSAVHMRDDLLQVEALHPGDKDAAFGLGLYDYYADVLPRLVKIMRFFMGIPAGDRARGLQRIESAREGSLFQEGEVHAQLYDIHAWFEGKPDRALGEAEWLRAHYPNSPLWALRLAEHLRLRIGDYARSARVAEEILAAAARGEANFSGAGVGSLARAFRGEALLLDGRYGEARAVLLPLRDGDPQVPGLGGRVRFLLGRTLELEGDREAALLHYRRAAALGDKEWRERAEEALETPVSAGEVRGRRLLAEARELRRGRETAAAARAEADAFAAWPSSSEAAVRVAEAAVRHGDPARARALAQPLLEAEKVEPAWTRAAARLVLARVADLEGRRQEAVGLYEQVVEEPFGQADLKREAANGRTHPFTLPPPPSATR